MGMRVARWYCADAHETFSLLPDCLAARLQGSLDEVEQVVVAVEGAASVEAAASALRPDLELPGAVRWVRRRLRGVLTALLALVTLMPGDWGRAGAEGGAGGACDRAGSGGAARDRGRAPAAAGAAARIQACSSARAQGGSASNTRRGLTRRSGSRTFPRARMHGRRGTMDKTARADRSSVTESSPSWCIGRWERGLLPLLKEKAAREYQIPAHAATTSPRRRCVTGSRLIGAADSRALHPSRAPTRDTPEPFRSRWPTCSAASRRHAHTVGEPADRAGPGAA
jgi:hypothetical protein